VRVGPTQIRVRTKGAGPPLLLLMGIGGSIEMWEPFVRHFPSRRLVMLDFPGTGNSSLSWLPPTMGFNAALIRMMLARLGLPCVDVLGYSWGGILAQHLAVQHPGVVRRLVLAATSVGLGGIPPSPRTIARLLTPKRYYSSDYFQKVAPSLYGGRCRSDPSIVEAQAADRVNHPPSRMGYAAQIAALAGYSTLPGLWTIAAPTLVVAGSDDPIVPLTNLRLLACAIPQAQLKIVHDAGHLLLLDSPDIVGPIVSAFLTAR
jgi:pimeloyl-ACP methyl ester carboxylesterase